MKPHISRCEHMMIRPGTSTLRKRWRWKCQAFDCWGEHWGDTQREAYLEWVSHKWRVMREMVEQRRKWDPKRKATAGQVIMVSTAPPPKNWWERWVECRHRGND